MLLFFFSFFLTVLEKHSYVLQRDEFEFLETLLFEKAQKTIKNPTIRTAIRSFYR